MKEQPIQVTCLFSGEAELHQIVQQSFHLYISQVLAKRRGYTA